MTKDEVLSELRLVCEEKLVELAKEVERRKAAQRAAAEQKAAAAAAAIAVAEPRALEIVGECIKALRNTRAIHLISLALRPSDLVGPPGIPEAASVMVAAKLLEDEGVMTLLRTYTPPDERAYLDVEWIQEKS